MSIGIIGLNDKGLGFALLCEKNGYNVVISGNEDQVFNLNQKIHLTTEPLLQSLLLDSNNLSATTNNHQLIEQSNIIFCFLESPLHIEGYYNTKEIFELVNNFYSLSSLNVDLYNKKLVICSPMNPGETEQIQQRLNMFNVQVAYNPEFCMEGEIIKNFEESSVTIIGTEFTDLSNEIIQIYSKIQKVNVNAVVMTPKSAEISKLGIITFLTSNKILSNLIGEFMTNSGIDDEIPLVLKSIQYGSKIEKNNLSYGFGIGGSLIPKGNRVLGYYFDKFGLETSNLPNTLNDLNSQHSSFLKKHYMSKNPDKSVPFVMNYLGYKLNSNSLDESQPYRLCIDLLDEGYTLHVIEDNEVIKTLSKISEEYDGRLKFFKKGTNPEGYKINL